MRDNASATEAPAGLTERVRLALQSGDLDAIRDLLDPAARWGAPEVPCPTHGGGCPMSPQPPAPPELDPDDLIGARNPNTARIWNYQLGGKEKDSLFGAHQPRTQLKFANPGLARWRRS
jgi:hypothetical protein